MSQIISNRQQIISIGVGSAHRNVVDERGIRTIINVAPISLIHYALKNPQVTITTDLCLIAINHFIFIYNQTPRNTSDFSPL